MERNRRKRLCTVLGGVLVLMVALYFVTIWGEGSGSAPVQDIPVETTIYTTPTTTSPNPTTTAGG